MTIEPLLQIGDCMRLHRHPIAQIAFSDGMTPDIPKSTNGISAHIAKVLPHYTHVLASIGEVLRGGNVLIYARSEGVLASGPVSMDGLPQDLWRRYPRQRGEAGFGGGGPHDDLPARLDPAERL